MLVVRGFSEAISAETPGPQKGSGIAIVTTAFDQDKLNLEKMISQAWSSKKTFVSNKMWTPADKTFFFLILTDWQSCL